jgi:hypothetical protein
VAHDVISWGPDERPGTDEMEQAARSYLAAIGLGQHQAVSGQGIGRIRLRRVADVSAASLLPFVQSAVAPGATVLGGGDQGENSATIRMRTSPVVAGRREGVARP